MKIRRLASLILTTAIRHAPSEVREWGDAMLREMDLIENHWAALFWALGGATALFRHLEVPMSDPSEVFARTKALMKKVHRRTLVGGIACFIGVLSFGYFIFIVPTLLQRIGACLTVASALYIAYQLYERRGSELPTETRFPAWSDFYRAELERQRDFHRGKWFWSRLVIMIPGYLMFCIGSAIAQPEAARGFGVIVAVFVVLCILAVSCNLKLASKYQRQIDELDSLPKER